MVSNGIRLALDVGAHRRKVYDAKPTIQSELWKRAFWYVVAARVMCVRFRRQTVFVVFVTGVLWSSIER